MVLVVVRSQYQDMYERLVISLQRAQKVFCSEKICVIAYRVHLEQDTGLPSESDRILVQIKGVQL